MFKLTCPNQYKFVVQHVILVVFDNHDLETSVKAYLDPLYYRNQ